MELNAQNCQSEADVGEGAYLEPGFYHVCINLAEEGATKSTTKPCIVVEYQALLDGISLDRKSPTVGQNGHVIKKTYSYTSEKGSQETEKCQQVLLRIALAAGSIKPGERKELDANDLLGRELVIEVRTKKKTSKSGQEYDGTELAMYGYWSLGNEEVDFVPKDPTTPGMQQLAKSGGSVNHPAPPAIPAATTTARKSIRDL